MPPLRAQFLYAPSESPAETGEITDEEVGFSPEAEQSPEGTEAQVATEGDGGLPDLEAAFKAHKLNLPSDPKELDRRYRELEARAKQADEIQNRMNWLLHQNQQREQAEFAKQRQAEANKPRPKLFDLPEYDPKWLDLVQRDENGNLVAKPGAMPDLPQKINAYAHAREEALNKFLADPMGMFQGQFGEVVDQRASQIAYQAMQQFHQQNELRKFEQENQEWVFEKGTTRITPAAQHWNQFYAEACQHGLADPIRHATDRLDAMLYRIRLEEDAKKKEPTDQDRKEAFLEAAARKPNRSGTFEKGTRQTPPQNPKNLWKRLEDKVKALPKEDFEEA